MIVIGIDPGITGAMATIVTGDGIELATVEDIPTSPRGKTGRRQIDAVALARKFDSVSAAAAYIEHAQASPQMGVSGSFGYGETFGVILGVLATHGFAVHLVRPQRWRQDLGLRKGSGKSASLTLARKLYPQLADRLERAKDHNRAEAILLAHYGCEQLERSA